MVIRDVGSAFGSDGFWCGNVIDGREGIMLQAGRQEVHTLHDNGFTCSGWVRLG